MPEVDLHVYITFRVFIVCHPPLVHLLNEWEQLKHSIKLCQGGGVGLQEDPHIRSGKTSIRS